MIFDVRGIKYIDSFIFNKLTQCYRATNIYFENKQFMHDYSILVPISKILATMEPDYLKYLCNERTTDWIFIPVFWICVLFHCHF